VENEAFRTLRASLRYFSVDHEVRKVLVTSRVSGAMPPNPAELLESRAMDEVLARLGERYELVVIDTAPMGVVSDAFPLLGKVDGVIVAPRIGVSTRDCAERLPEQLRRLEAPVLGIVINGIKRRRGRKYRYGYYGYGYGYGPASGSQNGAAAESAVDAGKSTSQR